MTLEHLVLRYAHISMGSLAILSGAVSMIARKGSVPHRRSGNVFFVSMLIMAATGTYLSIVIPPPNFGNVLGGSMAFYLTLTAWVTVWRTPGKTGALEVGAALLGLTLVVTDVALGLRALSSPTGRLNGYSPVLFFSFAAVAGLGTMLDARMLARGGLTGAARTTRHLWRMCAAMFMATASFFLGQAKLFPPAVRQSGVLTVPVLLVIGALLYWLIRVRVLPSIRKLRLRRTSSSLPGT